MAVRRTQQTDGDDSQPARRRGRPPRNAEPEEQDEEMQAVAGGGDDDYDFTSIPNIADFRPVREPDAREVEDMTDRIFSSVLSRFGWERHGSRIEHVGEEGHGRHR